MPEAPDLYVVREYLERRLTGQTVTKAEALRPIVLRCLAAPLERFAEDIAGRSLDGFWRRGKFLGIELSGGSMTAARRVLVVNPMLSGALQHCAPTERVSARTFLSLTLSDGSQLRYTDDDQMGMVYYLLPEQLSQAARLGEQGPDVLDEPLSLQAFADRLKPYRGELKGVLTRGGAVSGIGNAYADEVLFRGRHLPLQEAHVALACRARRAPRRRVPRPRRSQSPSSASAWATPSTARSATTSKYTAAATKRAPRAARSSPTSPATATARTTAGACQPGSLLGGGRGRYATASTSTSAESPLTSVSARATFKSYICCRFIQNSGVIPRTRPMRSAVPAVIPRRQWTISFTRTAGTPIALAKRYWEMPSSARNSAKCSPGWIGSTSTAALLSGSPLSLSLQRLAQSKQSRRAIGH